MVATVEQLAEELIRFTDDGQMRIHFNRFDLSAYRLFIKAKSLPEYDVEFDADDESYTITAPARFASWLGVSRPSPWRESLPFASVLFDDQISILKRALDAKRFAVWSDCGLGKTLIELEFARQVVHRTNGRVLIVSLNDIVPQIIKEAAKFYGSDLPTHRIGSQQELIEWAKAGPAGVAVTNYEKFNPKSLDDGAMNELRLLSGIVLDESSRLKGGGGSKQKAVINSSCTGIEYKLSCTATPAPNNVIEFVSQATFLEKVRTERDIIWTFFERDDKTHRREVKPHARAAFFDYMASWSIYLKHPKRFGWRLDVPDVPEPEYFTHNLPANEVQARVAHQYMQANGGEGSLLVTREPNAIERVKLAQIARGFIYRKDASGREQTDLRYAERIPADKPSFVADLIRQEVADGHQVLCWTTFDEESEILSELLRDAPFTWDLLTGATKDADRTAILDRFQNGESRCLIGRARMLGYGLNFQCCSSMVFSGFNESFEDLYQAIRRAVRHGQTESVRVHYVVVPELEGDTFANLKRKAAEHERATSEMEENYLKSFNASAWGAA